MKRAPIVAAVAGLLVMTACSGPTLPFEVGVKDYATDVLLGAPPADLQPTPIARLPLDAYVPPASGRGDGDSGAATTRATAPTTLRTTTTGAPVACPEADPLGSPTVEASRTPPAGPPAASYPWRATGTATFGDRTFPVPAAGTWRITDVVTDPDSGFVTFDLVETSDGVVETSSYRVVPEDGFEPDALRGEVSQSPGLYLLKQVIVERGETAEYEWSPPVLMLPLPVTEDSEWDVNSVAGDGTVLTFSGRIGEPGDDAREPSVDPDNPDIVDFGVAPTKNARVRVDACGRWIQGWNVRIEEGTLLSPAADTDVTFSESWAFGNQYGAIPLALTRVTEGTVVGTPISTSRKVTVNTEPLAARP